MTSPEVVRYALIELVRQEYGRTRRELHPRFKGGKVHVVLGGNKQAMPAERFFSIVDRLRSGLDALEAEIERKKEALAEDAAELRGQVARMHGSFTTFNVLFADREDYFSSKE